MRSVLLGLLSSSEETGEEADRETGEKEAVLETVSKKLDRVVEKILVNP